jgi:hypothetical protein
MSRKLFLLILLILFCLSNLTRWAYRSRLGHERFSAESAAHFRYTRMIASGERIPSVDKRAQWPEGLRVFRETSIGMEYVYGLAWRMMPGKAAALDVFARWFSVLIFSVSIFPIAYLSSRLWRSRPGGVISALLFAVALPVVGRSSGFELIRENLTIPLILIHAALLVRAAGPGGRGAAVLSVLPMTAALATWQGTQFYAVPLILFLLVRLISGRRESGELLSGLAVMVSVLAAGLAVPFLREGRFLLSPAAALSAGWLAAALARSRFGRGRYAAAAAALAGIALVALPSVLAARGHFAIYSHFFRLIAYKVRYISKPADPSLLPFDVRAFWAGPFHSPDALHLFVFALPVLLLLPGPLRRLAGKIRRDGGLAEWFVIFFLAVFFFLFLLMQRLLPFFGAAAIVTAGGLAASRADRRVSAPLHAASSAFSVLVIVVMALQVLFWAGKFDVWRNLSRKMRIPLRRKFVVYPIARDPEGEMLEWIRANTGENDVILSLHYHSPQILTYTGRPTNLNDFFEAPRLREKSKLLLEALHAGERQLLELCRKGSSTYLVAGVAIACDPSKDSPLYQAGFAAMPEGCAAERLMFAPESLDSFDLVYENEMFRVFRVGASPVARRRPRSPIFYDGELLGRAHGDIDLFYDTAMYMYASTARASSRIAVGAAGEAEGILMEALRTHYFHPAWRMLDRLYAEGGENGKRMGLADFALSHDPWRVDVIIAWIESRLAAGETGGVGEKLERCRGLPMTGKEEKRLQRLGEILEGALQKE